MIETVRIQYKCGHALVHYLTEANKQNRIDYCATIDCPKCEKAAYLAEHADENAQATEQAADWNKTHGCTALQGSEKQISWAESIRHKILTGYIEQLQDMQANGIDPTTFNKANSIIEQRKLESSARWWIEHRWAVKLEKALEEVA